MTTDQKLQKRINEIVFTKGETWTFGHGIIYRPIDLELLLMAIQKLGHETKFMPSNVIEVYGEEKWKVYFVIPWRLGKPYSKQPQETKTAVETLFMNDKTP